MSAELLNLIIPVFNEKDNILKTFGEIQEKVTYSPKKLFIIYDFEEDNTLPIVKEYIRANSDLDIVLLRNKYGRGALNAIKTGLESFEDGPAVVVMADASDDLAVVDRMMDLYEQGYKLVCGSRYMKGGRQIGGPWFKKLLSRLAGVSLHYLVQIPTHDVTNSFKLYSREVIDSIRIDSVGGFELGMEVTVKAYHLGLKIAESPSVWLDRTEGKSNFKLWSWLPRYMYWYLYALIKCNFIVRKLKVRKLILKGTPK